MSFTLRATALVALLLLLTAIAVGYVRAHFNPPTYGPPIFFKDYFKE